MAVTATISVSPAKLFLSSPTVRAQQQRPCPNFYRPFVSSRTNPTALRVSRLGISEVAAVTPKRAFRVLAISGVGDGDSDTPESGLNDSNEGATIDLKLPRRRLLVQFTCNSCGERTKRLVNRLAYERGTVFVQCAGCQQHHKLVDNLGLVVEYDFREEINVDMKTDQV